MRLSPPHGFTSYTKIVHSHENRNICTRTVFCTDILWFEPDSRKIRVTIRWCHHIYTAIQFWCIYSTRIMRGLQIGVSLTLLLCLTLVHRALANVNGTKLTGVDKILPVKKVKLEFNATQAKMIEQRNKPKIDFLPQGTRPQSGKCHRQNTFYN